MTDFEEQITDGDDPAEVDVDGEQGEADWNGEPVSDALLAPAVREQLGR